MVIINFTLESFSSFFVGADGSLVIKSGETFTINTNAGKAAKNSTTQYELSFQNHSIEVVGKSNTPYKWNYSVAHLMFKGNITFESGSYVVVTGAHALSITSLEGDITVNTSMNFSCTTRDAAETCLGGYSESEASVQNSRDQQSIYRGL